jgi:hypothetical protein
MDFQQLVDRRDGVITVRRSGLCVELNGLALPITRLTPEGASTLGRAGRLRTLDLCGRHLPTDVLTTAEAILPWLTCATIQGAFLPASQLASLLAGLTNLEEIDLSGCAVEAGVLAALQAARRLDVLWLGLRRIDAEAHRFIPPMLDDATLAGLGQLTSLRALGLRGRPVGAGTIAAIASLPCLEHLDLGETDVDDDAVAHLQDKAGLRFVELDGTKVTDTAARILASLELDRISVAGTGVGTEGVSALLAQKDWRGLDLSRLSLPDHAFTGLRRQGGLDDLALDHVPGAARLFAEAVSFPHLRRLHLRGTAFDRELALAIASACPCLRELALGAVPTDQIGALAGFDTLRDLYLGHVSADAQGWNLLRRHTGVRAMSAPALGLAHALPPGLSTLALSGEVDGESMAALHGSGSLTRLQLADAGRIGHPRAGTEVDMSCLREFIAERAGLDDAGLALLSGLPRCEALYISGNVVTGSGLSALAGHPLIHTLELRDSRVGDAIVGTLLSLARLHCIDVAGSDITGAGLASLAAGPNLQSLGIDGIQFDAPAAKALAHSPLLVELYLYPPFEGTAFSRLAALSQVREVRLMGVHMDRAAAIAFASMSSLRCVVGFKASPDAIDYLRAYRPDVALDGLVGNGEGKGAGRSAAGARVGRTRL